MHSTCCQNRSAPKAVKELFPKRFAKVQNSVFAISILLSKNVPYAGNTYRKFQISNNKFQKSSKIECSNSKQVSNGLFFIIESGELHEL